MLLMQILFNKNEPASLTVKGAHALLLGQPFYKIQENLSAAVNVDDGTL